MTGLFVVTLAHVLATVWLIAMSIVTLVPNVNDHYTYIDRIAGYITGIVAGAIFTYLLMGA